MILRLIFRIILKIVVCVVGSSVAFLLISSVSDTINNVDPEIQRNTTIAVGMFVGVVWSIEHRRARHSLLWWTVGGFTIGMCADVVAISHQIVESWRSGHLILSITLIGLFAGSVSALSSVGAFRK